jgi:CheY-like chemotaxis protein
MSRLGRVLCIEDDADVLTVLSFALRRHGADAVETAMDGVTGIAKARTFQPDLVLCDLMMPGVDGFEVVRQMRADEHLKNVPVIFLTAYAATAFRSGAEDVGAVGVPGEALPRADARNADLDMLGATREVIASRASRASSRRSRDRTPLAPRVDLVRDGSGELHPEATAPDVPDGLSFDNTAFSGGLEIRGLAWRPHRRRARRRRLGAPSSPGRDSAKSSTPRGSETSVNDPEGNHAYSNFVTNFLLGARYRREIGPELEGYVGFGLHRIGTPLFRYTEESTVDLPDLLRVPVTGERVHRRADLREGRSLRGRRHRTDARHPPTRRPRAVGDGEYQLGRAFALRAVLGLEWRTIHFQVVDDDAHVRVIEPSILLGVTYLRF